MNIKNRLTLLYFCEVYLLARIHNTWCQEKLCFYARNIHYIGALKLSDVPISLTAVEDSLWYTVPLTVRTRRRRAARLRLDLSQWLTSFWSCNHDVRQSKVRTTCENLVHSPGESWESHWSCSLSRDPLECILHLRSTLPHSILLCFATVLPASSGTFLPESRGT